MSDRELLELAAKAAGLPLEWHEPDESDPWCFIPSAVPPHNRRASDANQGVIWDPLTDDGDALRLAVSLRIDLNLFAAATPDPWVRACIDRRGKCYPEQVVNGDPLAATRRAIVRAAAAIGTQS